MVRDEAGEPHHFIAQLRRCVRETDTVARFGSDEFVLLLEDSGSPEEATASAARALAAPRQPVVLGGREAVAPASIGVALNTGGSTGRRALAKEVGGDRWQLSRSRPSPAAGGAEPPSGPRIRSRPTGR